MANFDRLGKNIKWLTTTLPAFRKRFDSLGQENPLAPERIAEMWDVVKFIHKSITRAFNANERQPMYDTLVIFSVLLHSLVDLDRNATDDEVLEALHALGDVTQSMLSTTVKQAQRGYK